MKVKYFFAAAAIIFLSAASFAGGYRDSMNGLKVRIGTVFAVTLEANPTTGYLWEVLPAKGSAKALVTGSEYIPARTDLVGSGGVDVWSFKTVKKGRTRIEFVYKRPWEKDVPAIKKKTFYLEVL